jgi:hypothetical protein
MRSTGSRSSVAGIPRTSARSTDRARYDQMFWRLFGSPPELMFTLTGIPSGKTKTIYKLAPWVWSGWSLTAKVLSMN